MSGLIREAFAGPLDIVGDVHGEWAALQALLQHLGYRSDATHPQGRHLVFIGDLVDRGPDSPAVAEWVMRAVQAGQAQCLLGNHELLLLLGESRESLRWFLDPAHAELQPGGKFEHCRVVPPDLKPQLLAFFDSLPLALERPDLRLVHAAWHEPSFDAVRDRPSGGLAALYREFEATIEADMQREGLAAAEAAERTQYAAELRNGEGKPPFLPAFAEANLRRNLRNPLRVLTFGPDGPSPEPYYVMERWRMAERDRWWDRYTDALPVVVGHYWRQREPFKWPRLAPKMPPVFETGLPAGQWLGPSRNVFCVDYSVGARFLERKNGTTDFETRLGALRWPEREVMFETGEVVDARA
jgi:Calcineurin-like phosphoesterase